MTVNDDATKKIANALQPFASLPKGSGLLISSPPPTPSDWTTYADANKLLDELVAAYPLAQTISAYIDGVLSEAVSHANFLQSELTARDEKIEELEVDVNDARWVVDHLYFLITGNLLDWARGVVVIDEPADLTVRCEHATKAWKAHLESTRKIVAARDAKIARLREALKLAEPILNRCRLAETCKEQTVSGSAGVAHNAVRTALAPVAERTEPSFAPSERCLHPNSCARHGMCMYVGRCGVEP